MLKIKFVQQQKEDADKLTNFYESIIEITNRYGGHAMVVHDSIEMEVPENHRLEFITEINALLNNSTKQEN